MHQPEGTLRAEGAMPVLIYRVSVVQRRRTPNSWYRLYKSSRGPANVLKQIGAEVQPLLTQQVKGPAASKGQRPTLSLVLTKSCQRVTILIHPLCLGGSVQKPCIL